MRIPEASRGKLTRYVESRAGNISPGARRPRRPNLIIGSDQFNFSAEQLSDEPDAEGNVCPLRFGSGAIVERESGPRPRMRSGRTVHSLVRMPDTVAIAIIDEAIEQLHPAFIPAQEIEARHRLEPRQGERHISLHGIT